MLRLSIDSAGFTASDLAPAAAAIAGGGLVAMATDTLYGLAVDPRRADAVARVFAAKRRPPGEALPVIAADMSQVIEWFGPLPAAAGRLARTFWPGPLSLLLPAPPSFSAAVHAGTLLIAVRVPDHRVACSLARLAGVPLTATSANPSGRPPAATAEEVAEALGAEVDVLIDSGPARGGPPSTIVEATTHPRLVREGAVPWERVLRSLDEC
jgi:L-threonylcarbamoyladenylate synthase